MGEGKGNRSQLTTICSRLALLFYQHLPRGVKPLGDGPGNKRR
nr:MAG TPA_asm: hypothetical protein [Caudoviricetes sp.]